MDAEAARGMQERGHRRGPRAESREENVMQSEPRLIFPAVCTSA